MTQISPQIANFMEVGSQFVKHYYTQFDNKETRRGLAAFYHNEALLTFESVQRQGRDSIMEKLDSMPACRRSITKCDCQPLLPNHSLLVHEDYNEDYNESLDYLGKVSFPNNMYPEETHSDRTS